jgi:serine/threonine protein kinase
MICPRCQQVLAPDAHFCSSCGLSTAETNIQTEAFSQRETLKIPVDPLVGQVLNSKYQLVARLGEGGMGVVYVAHRLHIGGDVAVKVLHPEFVRDAKAIERFRREARSAAMIRHPNVVTIYDFNEAQSEGVPAYIVMELVRGTSLRDLLREQGKLPSARAVELMEQICAGVGAAHRQGIVHRDLKPDNVIIEPANDESVRETVKVLDFGLAKLRDTSGEFSLTNTGAMVGTPAYLSPEQCRGEPLDARSDVYGLGAILYEMLTGKRPFVATTIAGLIAQHLNEQPPPFDSQLGIASTLQAACLRALSKNPDQRQPDASTFSRELRATTLLSNVPGPADERPRKSGFLAWALLGAFLLLCGVAAALTITYLRSRSTASSSVTDTSKVVNVPGPGANVGGENETVPGPMTTGSQTSQSSGQGLIGTWTGSYGPLNQPATLFIKEQTGSSFSGVLEQSGFRISFSGRINESTREITFKETQVLSGSGWSLGENKGELSTDRKKMDGTGKDATGSQLGISYQWSFSKG